MLMAVDNATEWFCNQCLGLTVCGLWIQPYDKSDCKFKFMDLKSASD